MTTPHYPNITVHLTEQDGNAAVIIGAVGKALRRAGHGDQYATFAKEAMSGDYNNVITTAMKWVNVE